jgi:hypothetical protein
MRFNWGVRTPINRRIIGQAIGPCIALAVIDCIGRTGDRLGFDNQFLSR